MLLRGLTWLVLFQLLGTTIQASLLVSLAFVGWLMQRLIERQARREEQA